MNLVRFAGLVLVLLVARGVHAQERPRYGGELVYVVPTEPASYDAHREGTFALIHPLAPIYSTLLRFDPTDRTGTKVVGDIAESWTIAKDGRTYTFKLRRGVKFHDGSDLTSKDVKDPNAQVAAVRAERAHVQFRGFTPAERDSIVQALGPKATVQESPWDCVLLVGMNHEKKPWDDKRARRALTLALDRYQGSQALSRIAIVKSVAGVQVPGTPYATPPAELEKLAGYSHDIAKSRAEAKRLLKEASVPENFSFSLKNRNVPMPYEAVAIWLVDQWRQIGLQARHDFIESTKWEADLRDGNYEVAVDTQCSYAVDPDLDLYKFQSMGISGNNYGRYVDKTLDDLYQKQSRALDAEERRKYVRDFERRLLDEEAHYAYTLQWHRIIPHSAKLRGWTVTPSHFVNNQLDGVWLAE